MADYLRVTLKRSPLGRTKDQHQTIKGLGLRRIRHTSFVEDTPHTRGMINKIIHLLEWSEATAEERESFLGAEKRPEWTVIPGLDADPVAEKDTDVVSEETEDLG